MKIINYLLLPFSGLYALGASLRNRLYDKGIFKAASFDIATIGVGNLVMGGTGKTPMTEFLLMLFKEEYKLAILSRGYGRKNSGFRMAEKTDSSEEIGDEPFQYKQKFPDTAVYVGEDRVMSIPEILGIDPETNMILLDDVMQHRALAPHVMIMLTTWDRPFYNDHFFPSGQLRDGREQAGRADLVIVSKCPETLSPKEKKQWKDQWNFEAHQQVFFAGLKYQHPYSFWEPQKKIALEKVSSIFVFGGIAKLEPLLDYLKSKCESVKHIHFSDHHYFKQSDLDKIIDQAKDCEMILSTEKDAARLALVKEQMVRTDWPLFILPVEMDFNGQEAVIKKSIIERLEDRLSSE